MASIRKRGSNSYLIVISRGYDYEGNRLKSVQKTVKPPKEYTPKQAEKWVKEQAILFEREVQHTPEPINRSITLAKYIEHWAADIGPKKLADSTFRRDEQDIRRILPALGNYKLTDLRKEVIRDFYEEMRHSPRLDGRGNLSEKSVEGLHNTLCGILSAAVDEGYLTHNPAWRCYKPKGQKKERPVADEETVKKLITAFEGQSMKYETYFKLVLATGLRRGEACGLKWSDINWRKRTIHVQRGVIKLSHQESITKDPKTSSGDRMVYLSKEMCQLLKAWRKECEWDRQQTANETVDEDDYLFRQPNGKPMNPCTFTYRFKLILKANNLPLDLNVHSLRHTNASLLISQGVDVRTVILLFGIGYGAYYATADMPIPMVADCSDYETYQSGKYIPGIMGTLFSLVDKLVSSLSATVVGVAVSFIGLESLPTQYDPYTPGMNVVVIVLFCVIPMVAWAATLIAMKGYSLTGEKMKEIQAVNACRRDAVANGMSMEDAMRNYVKMEDVPDSYK